jgi:glutamate-1-semialdehyde aminotransferase
MVAETVRRYGGLFICDEVQTIRAHQRTGTASSTGASPEIMTFIGHREQHADGRDGRARRRG